MKQLADTVELDPGVNPEDVRDSLVGSVNLAWQRDGNEARCDVPASFLGWLIQEYDRLRQPL